LNQGFKNDKIEYLGIVDNLGKCHTSALFEDCVFFCFVKSCSKGAKNSEKTVDRRREIP
jgi:hypothetical protein